MVCPPGSCPRIQAASRFHPPPINLHSTPVDPNALGVGGVPGPSGRLPVPKDTQAKLQARKGAPPATIAPSSADVSGRFGGNSHPSQAEGNAIWMSDTSAGSQPDTHLRTTCFMPSTPNQKWGPTMSGYASPTPVTHLAPLEASPGPLFVTEKGANTQRGVAWLPQMFGPTPPP